MVVYFCKKCGGLMEPAISGEQGESIHVIWICSNCLREVDFIEKGFEI